jgi:hypothetical protein
VQARYLTTVEPAPHSPARRELGPLPTFYPSLTELLRHSPVDPLPLLSIARLSFHSQTSTAFYAAVSVRVRSFRRLYVCPIWAPSTPETSNAPPLRFSAHPYRLAVFG